MSWFPLSESCLQPPLRTASLWPRPTSFSWRTCCVTSSPSTSPFRYPPLQTGSATGTHGRAPGMHPPTGNVRARLFPGDPFPAWWAGVWCVCVRVFCKHTQDSCLPWLALCYVDPLAFLVHGDHQRPPGAEAQASTPAHMTPKHPSSSPSASPLRAGQPRGFASSPSPWVLRATRCGLAIQGTAFLL